MIYISESMKALKALLKECGSRCLALDIDDTISHTGPGYMKVLQEQFGNSTGLSPHAMWAQYGRTPVPGWDMEAIEAWIMANLTSSELHNGFMPIEGAQTALEQIEQYIPIGLYLTIREESLRWATRDWVRKHQFPTVPIEMVPRGIDHESGLAWKAMALEFLYPEVAGIIDDRIEMLSALSPGYKGIVFLFGHQEVVNVHSGAIPCPAWEDVLFRVREVFAEPSRC